MTTVLTPPGRRARTAGTGPARRPRPPLLTGLGTLLILLLALLGPWPRRTVPPRSSPHPSSSPAVSSSSAPTCWAGT